LVIAGASDAMKPSSDAGEEAPEVVSA